MRTAIGALLLVGASLFVMLLPANSFAETSATADVEVELQPSLDLDVQTALEVIAMVRRTCQRSPRVPLCPHIDDQTNDDLLQRLSEFDLLCERWATIEPEFEEANERIPHSFDGAFPIALRFNCRLPTLKRRYGHFLTSTVRPENEAARLDRLDSRLRNLQLAENLAAEKMARLEEAFVSLRLQEEEGRLDAATVDEYAELLESCGKHLEYGPREMTHGEPYEPWAKLADECTDAATEAVFSEARKERERTPFEMWALFMGALAAGAIALLLVLRRRERALGTSEQIRWEERIDEAIERLERKAEKTTDKEERGDLNDLLARAFALRRWIRHFGADATTADIRRAYETANLKKTHFVWSGFREPPKPRSDVFGRPRTMWRLIRDATNMEEEVPYE